MIKRQYILRPAQGRSPSIEEFADQVLGELSPRLQRLEPAALTLALTTSAPPRAAVIPFQRRPIALVSVWERFLEERGAEWAQLLEATRPALSVAGYLVQEALPVDAGRERPPGRRTPGVGLLTLLRRRAGLSDEELLRRWHEGHTPLSLELHPLWRYERNLVERALSDGAPPLDGIVEEHFRDAGDLLSPLRFFGGPWAPRRSRLAMAARMVPNMLRVAYDIRGFIDLPSLESYLVDEYVLL